MKLLGDIFFIEEGNVGIGTTAPRTKLDINTGELHIKNKIGINTTLPSVSLAIHSTDSVLLPKGNTNERPSGVQGYIRYNTDTNQFEGFGAGNAWGSLGGVKSTDQYTYITAELTPGTNDSNLRFYTSAIQQAIINSLGNLGIGTTSPIEKLHVEGNVYISQTLTASNLAISGGSIQVSAATSNTQPVIITNSGTGPALKVTQSGAQPIAEFYDAESGIALYIGNNGNIGIGSAQPQVSLVINRTDSVLLPKGSTIQRPDGVQGYIRYNTDTNQFEGFGAGNTWGSLGGVKSTDQYTYITAELTPGNNDSNLRFYTSATQQAIINPYGNLGIGTSVPTQKLHVEGSVYVSETLTTSNLLVFGTSTTLNTITSNSEQVIITNQGTGPALKVTQTGPESIAEFYDNESGIALFIGNNGNIGIGTTQPQVSFVINKTDSLLLPKGSTGERPAGVQGYIRYNTDTNQFEGYGAGNSWGSLGGVKSTDQLTYITAELSPGNNDSNLRFYTSGIQQAIINPDGNLGIGTASPRYKLDVFGNTIISGNLGIGTTIPSERLRVEGDLFVTDEAHIVNVVTTNNINTTNVYTSNLSTSNFTILQNFYYAPDSAYVRTHYQINPIRYTSVVPQQGTTIFNFTMDGLYKFLPTHAEVYQNGYKLAYYASNIKDYDVTYVNNEINTSITVTLEEPAQYNDIIDIYLWPSYLNVDGSLQPGYVIQNIDYTYWNRYDSITSNLYYTTGNVGIGTTNGPGRLNVLGHTYVTGNIYPTSCNIYDLGSRDLRFKDLYLSGNSINLGDTIISRDGLNGGRLKITDFQGNLLDITTNNISIPGSIGIGTTYYTQPLHVEGTAYIAGNLGIGTNTPRQKLDVIGNTIISGNLGIGTDNPVYKFQIEGNAYVSETLTASNLVIFGSSTVLNTVTSNSEQMVITNDGTGPALKVTQTGDNSVAEFYDNESGISLFIGNNGNIGIGSTQPQVSLVINKTDSLLLPKGSTVQRPEGVQGYIRYNTDTYQFEGYGAGNTWGSLGGVKSTDQYTYITAELTPGNNDSNLRFYTSAQQQAIINQVGNLGIGTTLPIEKLHVEGNIYVSQTLFTSNLTVFGSSTILKTVTSNTEQIVVTNDGTGPALKVTQTGNNSVAEFYDNESGIALFIGNNGNIGIGSSQPQVSLVINRTDSVLLPKGSTIQRPEGVQGYIRYNIDTNQFEGYGAGNTWGSLGGVKSTDQYTYITAELTPGNNDSNLRFYTSAQQQAILDLNGNLGIGTTNPNYKLHVEGTLYAPIILSSNIVTSNIYAQDAALDYISACNLMVYGELLFGINTSTLKTHLQINPVRKTFYVSGQTSNAFYVETPGIFTAYTSNVHVFLNQTLLMNLTPTINDYEVSSSYTSSPPVTTFVISLTKPAVFGDIVDITVWPQLIQESATNPGYVYQQVRVAEAHFNEINNDLAYIPGNIGIGTTNTTLGKLVVAGNIVPSACNIYDLGTSNLRFRDLYLSGNTIDLGGTKLSRDNITGGLNIQTTAGQLSDIRTKSVYISNTLEFTNSSFVVKANGNLGIGTTYPREKLEVNGSIIPSACNVYDLGTPNLRFRDLYLSGNTIDLDGIGQVSTSNQSLVFRVNNSQKMSIDNTGNLDINGNIGRWKAFPRDNGGVKAFLYTSVLGKDGRIYHAGHSYFGHAGNYANGSGTNETGIGLLRMAAIPNNEVVKMFACTQGAKMALTESNKIYIWGRSDHAILGLGNTNTVTIPTVLVDYGNTDTIIDIQFCNTQVTTNEDHTKHAGYLTASGRLFLWGYNVNGHCGNGTTTSPVTTPYEVPKISSQDWEGFAAQNYKTFAWTSASSGRKLYACGYNGNGSAGTGNTVNTNITTMTACIRASDNAQLTDIKKVQTNNAYGYGNAFTVVLTNSGDIYTCGINTYGQLGNGNTTSQNIFVGPILTNVKDFDIGRSDVGHSVFAIKNDGTLWVWGYNSHQVFGTTNIADNATQTTPYQVTEITNAYRLYGPKFISFGAMFLQKSDKSWWFAGQSWYGCGGLGDNLRYATWTEVRVPEEIIDICSFVCHWNNTEGNLHTTLMLGKSGRLWGCGYNGYGSLGSSYGYNGANITYNYLVPAYCLFSA